MGDFFKIPKAGPSKRKEKCDFLQPTKKPGFSISCPGVFKKSFYWRTFDRNAPDKVQLLSQSSASSDDLPHIASTIMEDVRAALQEEVTEIVEIESPEDEKARKCLQYSELIEGCKKKCIEMLEKLDTDLEEETISSEAASTTISSISSANITKTSSMDNSWLNGFHPEDQSVTSLNLETQILNEITGGIPDVFDGMRSVAEVHSNLSSTPVMVDQLNDSSMVSAYSLTPLDLTFDDDEPQERSQRWFFDFSQSDASDLLF